MLIRERYSSYAAELKKVTQLQKQWALRKPVLDAHCLALQKELLKLEQEIDELVMEKLKNEENQNANQRSVCILERRSDEAGER